MVIKYIVAWIAFLFALPSGVYSVYAQAVVEGRVTAAGDPVPFAHVGVRGTTLGTAANEDGRYRLAGLDPGTYTFVASAIGYRTVEREVTVSGGETLQVDFVLEESEIQLDGIVVTGTMKETFVSESPVKVEVISARYLDKVPASSVMEVIENVNGLYQQIDCGVCYTNNIRINGIEGPYTAVLIDGMPIMSALAAVYGLNGISPSLIQQIEVIKGPASTLYGTEAMGGVVNIITKRPESAPRLSVNTYATLDGETNVDVAMAPRARALGLSMLLSGSLYYMDTFIDENGDTFTDVPLARRLTLFAKGSRRNEVGLRTLDISTRYYFEDRFGGVEAWTKALRGSDEVYGESIYTHRVEVVGAYRPSRLSGRGRIEAALNVHDQDSYYGDTRYAARQHVYVANLIWNPALGQRNDLLAGATLRYQRYDDNTPATRHAERRFIPGLFLQNETLLGRRFRALGGVRLDHHEEHGFIISPRASLKYTPSDRTTLRLNSGTGFRVVNLFTEDHAALTGAREVVILEDLQPERSYSLTASLQHIIKFNADPLTIDIDGFYTYFTNKIIPNYDVDPNLIVYTNLQGSSVSRGAAISLSQSFTTLPLTYTVGATLMDVFAKEGGDRRPVEYAPAFQGVVNASYHMHGPEVTVDYTANVTGPMHLPEYEEPFRRPTRSRTFSVHNIQVTRDFEMDAGALLQAYLAVENMFDYTQPSPLIDPFDPFGEHFDTAYVYGPMYGRHIGAGVRLTLR